VAIWLRYVKGNALTLGIAKYRGTKMLELIEVELTRTRGLAKQANESFLVYLIDVAIIEAKARCSNNSLEALIPRSLELNQRVGSAA
jgi:hypothetical protein